MDIVESIQTANVAMFYYLLTWIIYDLSQYSKNYSELDYMPKLEIKSIVEDDGISDEKKIEIMDNLLNVNSLIRHYVLYFIFKKQGIFYTSIDLDNDDEEAFNAYEEYLFWKTNYDNGRLFNLDENENLNHSIMITENKIYETSQAHINFISWVYYSGLYHYLTDPENIHIKKRVLDEMYNCNILAGNTFLQYVLFTTVYESIYPTTDINIKEYIIGNTETNVLIKKYIITDDTTILDNTIKSIDEDVSEDATSEEDTTSEEEDNCVAYSQMIGDIDKYRFLYELSKSGKKLFCRLKDTIVKNVKEFIKEEAKNIFKSHLS